MFVRPLKLLGGWISEFRSGDMLPPSILGEGEPGEFKFLRSDSRWVVPPGAEGAVSSLNGKFGNLVLTLGGALITATLSEVRKHVGVALSNGNLTATFPETQSVVLGDVAATTGKLYFEVRFVGGSTSGNCAVGVAPENQPLNSQVGYDGATMGEIALFQNSGNVYQDDGSRPGSMGGFATAGSVVGVAVDCDARKIWFRVNGGLWNGVASASPTTGTGGFTVSGTGAIYPAICTDEVATFTANFGNSTFQSALPLDYSPWGGSSEQQAVAIGDVQVSTPVLGQTLAYDGHHWVNGPVGLVALVPEDKPTGLLDRVRLVGKMLAGRALASVVGAVGGEAVLQPSFFQRKISAWSPVGSTVSAATLIGMDAPTAVGTATARAVATTNRVSRARRAGYVSAATAGAVCGVYWTAAQWTTGDAAGLGGFMFSCRFAFSDAATATGARAFVGMSANVAAPTNVDPATLTNSIGVAQLHANATQLYLVCAGTTAQAAIALGTDFPPMASAGATNGVLYELTLYAAPGEPGVINYSLERLGTAFVAKGRIAAASLGVQVPGPTVLMAPRAWRSNNAASVAVGLDLCGVYLESET